MTAEIIDGRALARTVRGEVSARVARLAERGVTPGLAVVFAGDDPGSRIYVRNKARMAARVGIEARTVRLPAEVSAGDLLSVVDALNRDESVHGILVQLPLPRGISADETRAIIESIDPHKDVDGLHPSSLGALVSGRPGFVACTPSGCMRMLAAHGIEPRGRRAVVIGRSAIVGKPMALLLLAADATVTLCHSRTADLAEHVRAADIVVAAVGRPQIVRGDWLKPGAAVIDVGINRRDDGTLVGDVHFEEALAVAGHISPVPGGVGPMTIASLLHNVCLAAERGLGESA